MKKSRFLLIPLLFIGGVLLLSLLLRWGTSRRTEAPSTHRETHVTTPDYTRWHLPEGATLRLGKGRVKDIKFVGDGTQFAVATSIGIWLYDAHTGAEISRLNTEPINITTITTASDPTTLISSAADGDMHIWDIPTAELRSTFRGPKKITDAVSGISPEGIQLVNKRLQFGDIQVWTFDLETKRPRVTDLMQDPKWKGYGIEMALAPDASLLATEQREGRENYPLRIWDMKTGELVGILKGRTQPGDPFAFSPDNTTLASSEGSNTIRLWDMDTQTPRETFKIPDGGCSALTFSPNGKILASGSRDGSVRLWDATVKKQEGEGEIRKSTPLLTLKEKKNNISTLTFSPDGKTLITASSRGDIQAWDTTTGRKRFTCTGHFGNVAGIVFSENGSTFTSMHEAYTWAGIQLETWDRNTKHRVSTRFLDIDNQFSGIAADGKTVVTHEYWSNRPARLWDLNTERARSKLKGPVKRKRRGAGSDFHTEFTFSPSGTTVANGGSDNVVRLWDTIDRKPSGLKRLFAGFADTRSPRLTIHGHPVHARKLAFSPDEKMIAGGSIAGHVYLWDAHTGKKLFTLRGHGSRISAVAFSPDGKRLASGGVGGEISLWYTADGSQGSATLMESRATVSRLRFSPDGNILISGNGEGVLHLWDVHTGRLLSTHIGHRSVIRVLSFSPDGNTLASGGSTLLLWEWDTLKRAGDR